MSKGCEGQFFHFISLFYRSVKKIKKMKQQNNENKEWEIRFLNSKHCKKTKIIQDIELLKNQIVKILNDK